MYAWLPEEILPCFFQPANCSSRIRCWPSPVFRGGLTIHGTDSDDWVEIQETQTEIIVHVFDTAGLSQLQQWEFAKTSVQLIEFFGYAGNNTFKNWYRETDVFCAIPCHAEGGARNDTLIGGLGNDYLYGSDGNNVLNGGDGDNIVIGGFGSNTFYNTGTGSNCFVWIGENDQWAAGSSNGGDDAQVFFSSKDRLGKMPDDQVKGEVTTTYTFEQWNMENTFNVVNTMRDLYDTVGGYRYFRNE